MRRWQKHGSLWRPPTRRAVGAQQQQSSDHDPNRLRWGDRFSLFIPNSLTVPTLQIVNARTVDLPATWTILLYADIAQGSLDGNLVECFFKITLGVGAATTDLYYTLIFDTNNVTPVITPWSIDASGQVSPIADDSTNSIYTMQCPRIPARDIQIQCTVLSFLEVFPINMNVGAWVAPLVPAPPRDVPQPTHPWMPEGFHPEHLKYR
jgi:hypothetical protein